jgi:hypothetical protein
VPLYIGYSDSVGDRTAALVLVAVDADGDGSPSGLGLSLSPRRLLVGPSGAGLSLRLSNAGTQPREVGIEALITPSCKPLLDLPEGALQLEAGAEVSITLRVPPSPCGVAGEYPVYFLARPLAPHPVPAVVAEGTLLAQAPHSVLEQVFSRKDQLLWVVRGLLLLLIASITLGLPGSQQQPSED